ncbi:hypothetical protein OQJ46_16770 [Microbulbifer thermotolerans]|uniref:hypothetical protein n=1 Tax=Microbulbifer thermotolerans TaxID=252514 RepID=UPI00224ADE64|nr:hypothetical protein [Microbulbifer thermotolerans]MCX2784639.1 hypothetical protein [Microbulbifer thermotolerans]
MNASLSSALVYILGFIGLIAIGVIPVRSWFVLRRAYKGAHGVHKLGKLLTALLVLIVVAILWGDLQVATRIFKCLTETYCGPSIASGWTYLAILGFWYLIFEAVIFVVHRFAGGTEGSQIPKNNF